MNRCRGFDAFPFPISRLIFYINYYRQVTWQDSISRRDALYCVQYDAYYLFGEMKLLHIICFWLSVSLGLLIFIQIPIIKLSTPNAVKLIEDHCLRKDLTDQDTAKYQWAKRWILFNENQCRRRLGSARHLGLGVCLVLLIQSVVGLRHERNLTIAEPGAAPNGGHPTPPGNSGAAEGPPSVS